METSSSGLSRSCKYSVEPPGILQQRMAADRAMEVGDSDTEAKAKRPDWTKPLRIINFCHVSASRMAEIFTRAHETSRAGWRVASVA